LFSQIWQRYSPAKRPLQRTILQKSTVLFGRDIDVPKNKNVHIWGTDPVIGPWSGDFTNLSTSKVYLIGFPGLEVNKTDGGYNSDTTYAAPENVE